MSALELRTTTHISRDAATTVVDLRKLGNSPRSLGTWSYDVDDDVAKRHAERSYTKLIEDHFKTPRERLLAIAANLPTAVDTDELRFELGKIAGQL